MRITNINIPKNFNDNGIEDIRMSRLEQVVLIAGKNGSGKTRILEKITRAIGEKPQKTNIEYYIKEKENIKQNISQYELNIANFEKSLLTQTQKNFRDQTLIEIERFKGFIESRKIDLKEIEKSENWDLITTSELSDIYSIIPFVPKELNLIDCNTFSKSEILTWDQNANSIGINSLQKGTFAKIQAVQNRWFAATHPSTNISEIEKNKAIADYQKLTEIIKVFLNTDIGRNIDGDAIIFNFPLGKSNLSNGQKILLQFCIAIFSQEIALKDIILVLDEPENHLHPSVIIETIDRILNCVTNGQIWISTHSIPLLAHFNPNLVWYVENNKIEHAGKIPEKVLHSLIGDESEVGKLQDFISLPSQYATSSYAFESLLEPIAVLTNSNDSQSFQIRSDLLKLSSNGKLRVLDYGCGKGRLISNIVDLDAQSQERLIEHIDYIAFDKFRDDKTHCEHALSKAYGDCENKYFNDFGNLLSVYDKGSFDVVIMCNVLHEIDPKEWLKLFQNDGLISNLLKDNGILLLVEDHQIPIGEKAYQKGFLVLDTPQLKDLFKITEKDHDFTYSDKNGDGRLKAHRIPKKCLIQIDEVSRLNAIKSLSTTAREKILEIREKESTYKNGKLHGFWTQQFANAQLNIAEFTTN